MKIIKRNAQDIPVEEAHNGNGSRKVYASKDHLRSAHFEAMTHGFLPAGATFDWHEHKDIEEIMMISKGSGVVCDDEGEYAYAPGDVIIFPANIRHKVVNSSSEDHEMIFVRVKL